MAKAEQSTVFPATKGRRDPAAGRRLAGPIQQLPIAAVFHSLSSHLNLTSHLHLICTLYDLLAATVPAYIFSQINFSLGTQALQPHNPTAMSRHHPDLVMCRKQAGIAIGRLCDKCDGKCPVCDSYVRPTTLVRICDECSFGNYQNKCVVCGGEGISDAFYCFECTRLEKDRDGCPKIINLGSSRTDLFYQKKTNRTQQY